ncbi:MAG: hypothetical protein R3E53_11835 [Myxococcota bacterium]
MKLDTLHPIRRSTPRPQTASAFSLADWTDSSLLFYWNRWRAARYPRPGDGNTSTTRCSHACGTRSRARPFGRTPRTRAEARLEIIQQLVARLDDLEGLPARPTLLPCGRAERGGRGRLRDAPGAARRSHSHCADALAARARLIAYLERMESRIRPARGAPGPVDGDAGTASRLAQAGRLGV